LNVYIFFSLFNVIGCTLISISVIFFLLINNFFLFYDPHMQCDTDI